MRKEITHIRLGENLEKRVYRYGIISLRARFCEKYCAKLGEYSGQVVPVERVFYGPQSRAPELKNTAPLPTAYNADLPGYGLIHVSPLFVEETLNLGPATDR